MNGLNVAEITSRLLKYLVEGLAVGLSMLFLVKKASMEEILAVSLIAGLIFSILDLMAPSIASSARFGAGARIGWGMMPM